MLFNYYVSQATEGIKKTYWQTTKNIS